MIVLDTHALIWFSDDLKKFSDKALKIININKKGKSIYVSSISIWEIALLVKGGKLNLSLDIDSWIFQLEKASYIHFIPLNNEIGIKSVYLPGTFHKDPADRIIVATARSLGAKLITADSKIRSYKHVQTVW